MKASPKGILLVHAPTGDSELLFRGAPMSLLYAISVLAENLQRGLYKDWGRDDLRLYDPALDCASDPPRALAEIEQLLELHKPIVVGIGTTSYALYWALEIARVVKRWDQRCIIIFGGPHEDEAGALSLGGSIADHSDVVDFSIQGDAEYLLERLFSILHAHKFGAAKAKSVLLAEADVFAAMQGSGAISFSEGESLRTVLIGRKYRPGLRTRGPIPLNLDSLPQPPRWLLDHRHEYLFDVFTEGRRPKRTAQMLTTRGCDFGCTFCTERGAVSHRNVQGIMDEIYSLRRQGYEAIFFDDSTFHLYPYLSDLLNELAAVREELRMDFGCLTRVDTLVKELPKLPLARFADAGFNYFYLGIEHDDDVVLKEMQKGYDRAKLRSCLDLFRDTDFRLGVSLLFGFNSETEESRKRTLVLVAEHPAIVLANLSIVAFHPAAQLVRSKKKMLRYDVIPPNLDPAWDLFEEGRWFHPDHITLDYARSIHRLVCEVEVETNGGLIRKLKRARNVLGPRVLAEKERQDYAGTLTAGEVAADRNGHYRK